MARPTPPLAARRQRAAHRALEACVLVVFVVGLLGGLVRVATPLQRVELPPPLSVDLVGAPAALLELLPGIGPARAAAIVADRESAPPLGCIDDLRRVRGIGPGIVRRIRRAADVRAIVRPPPDPGPPR